MDNKMMTLTLTKDCKDADEGKGKGSGKDPGGVGHRVDWVLLGSLRQSHRLLQSWCANVHANDEYKEIRNTICLKMLPGLLNRIFLHFWNVFAWRIHREVLETIVCLRVIGLYKLLIMHSSAIRTGYAIKIVPSQSILWQRISENKKASHSKDELRVILNLAATYVCVSKVIHQRSSYKQQFSEIMRCVI